MRFTHYMQYFVDLEGGKLIPVSVFFWRPMCNFSRGVLITIYSISWWWWSADRVCPWSIFDLPISNLGRGFLLRLFCSEPLFDKIWWYFCSRDDDFWVRWGEANRVPPPSTVRSSPRSEPSIIHPNTRSPAFAASYWYNPSASLTKIDFVHFWSLCMTFQKSSHNDYEKM